MTHGREADAYDYLATSKVSELTVTQLEQALENSFLNKSNIEFWKGPVTMNRVLEVSRTYPHGLPIPEKSITVTALLPAGDNYDVHPSGSEVWNVIAIQALAASGSPPISVNTFDGASTVIMHRGTAGTAAASFFPWESPLPLTNTGYLRLSNEDLSDAAQVSISYHMVSL